VQPEVAPELGLRIPPWARNLAEVIERYLGRIGLDGSDRSLETLVPAHVRSITYENLDVRLGREIRLDVESLVAKMVDRRRGGYCYEQNTLFAAALEALGYAVTRCLGRVRLGHADGPRPCTHMTLVVDDQVVDVGFGAANPLGPVPLGGEATYGPYRWVTERTVSPEGEDAWLVRLSDLPLYTFTDEPQHPVDYVAPNHYSSTHPQSIFTQNTIVQRWAGGGVQVGLVGLQLTERHPDGTVDVDVIDPADLRAVLRDRFALDVDEEEAARLGAAVAAARGPGGPA
jgi:N-hydroxyarylamine O-acetyltransferase